MSINLTSKSASCLNHLKHGSTSKTLFIGNENPEDFFAILENAFEQYQPAYDYDAALIVRSVRAHWTLLRREKAADAIAQALYSRKADPLDWIPADLHELAPYDRYKTEAARQHSRCLKDLATIQKLAADRTRWQLQFEKEKAKLAPDVEFHNRAQKAKEKEKAKEKPKDKYAQKEAELAEIIAKEVENQEVLVDDEGPHIPQAVFVAQENGVTKVFDRMPTNAEVKLLIASRDRFPVTPTEVCRTYVFAGLVPPEYQWLIAEEWERHTPNLELRQSLTFEEWQHYADHE